MCFETGPVETARHPCGRNGCVRRTAPSHEDVSPVGRHVMHALVKEGVMNIIPTGLGRLTDLTRRWSLRPRPEGAGRLWVARQIGPVRSDRWFSKGPQKS